MLSNDPGPALIGRRSECEVLDRLLTDVRAHNSRVLVLRGEAGVGKSALMEYVARAPARVSGRADRGRRVGDGAAVRGRAPAVRADVESHRRSCRARNDDTLGMAFGLVVATRADRFLMGSRC